MSGLLPAERESMRNSNFLLMPPSSAIARQPIPAQTFARCLQCGKVEGASGTGKYGVGDHDGLYYCGPCWMAWETDPEDGEKGGTLEKEKDMEEQVEVPQVKPKARVKAKSKTLKVKANLPAWQPAPVPPAFAANIPGGGPGGVLDQARGKAPLQVAPPKQVKADPAKEVIFIRHGQAMHNHLWEEGRKQESALLRDPGLTELGVRQAEYAGKSKLLAGVELVAVSPCRRTLGTAVVMFRDAYPRPPIVALADVQECNDSPCDTGSPVSVLFGEFSDVDFGDLLGCPDDWFKKVGLMDRSTDEVDDIGLAILQARLRRVKEWLRTRKETRIAIVSHHMFLCHFLGVDFANCEVIEMKLEQGKWTVLANQGVVPLYRSNGERVVRFGSPPLLGTLSTLRLHNSEDAVRMTCDRNELEYRRRPGSMA